MIVLCLVKGLVQFGIDRFTISHSSLQIFKLLNVWIEKSVKCITFFLEPLSLVFESFNLSSKENYCDCQIFVFLVGSLVFVIDGLDLHSDLLNFIESGIIHSLLEGVFPDEFLNMEAGLLQVDFEKVDFFSEVEDRVFVNVTFDPE